MPITQSRMIALINSATEMREAYARLTASIKQSYANAASGAIDPLQALNDLALSCDLVNFMPHYTEAVENLAAERAHFARHAKKNAQIAANQLRKRRAAGIPPSPYNTAVSRIGTGPILNPFAPPTELERAGRSQGFARSPEPSEAIVTLGAAAGPMPGQSFRVAEEAPDHARIDLEAELAAAWDTTPGHNAQLAHTPEIKVYCQCGAELAGAEAWRSHVAEMQRRQEK